MVNLRDSPYEEYVVWGMGGNANLPGDSAAVTKLDPGPSWRSLNSPLKGSRGHVNSPSQKGAPTRRIARGTTEMFFFKLIAFLGCKNTKNNSKDKQLSF